MLRNVAVVCPSEDQFLAWATTQTGMEAVSKRSARGAGWKAVRVFDETSMRGIHVSEIVLLRDWESVAPFGGAVFSHLCRRLDIDG